jgi:hypothetical protein
MKPKCKYPDMGLVRRQMKDVTAALTDLAALGVEVLVVSFRQPAPVIEVSCCRGCDSIQHAFKGRGRNTDGKLYVRRVAHMRGCVIEWSEEQAA